LIDWMSSIGRDSSIFIGRGESKEQTRDKNLDRQKKSHVTTYSGALLNMLSSFLTGVERHKRALMYNYQGQAGYTVYYKRGAGAVISRT